MDGWLSMSVWIFVGVPFLAELCARMPTCVFCVYTYVFCVHFDRMRGRESSNGVGFSIMMPCLYSFQSPFTRGPPPSPSPAPLLHVFPSICPLLWLARLAAI